MNNIYNGHEFKLNLGSDVKTWEEEPSNIECIGCGLKIQCSLFYSDLVLRQFLKKELGSVCLLKRKQ